MVRGNTTSSKPVKKKRRVKTQTSVMAKNDDLDTGGLAAARMFYDPCGADLAPSAYPGDRGYVNRFVANFTVANTGGITSIASIWKPGNAVSSNISALLPSDPQTITYANAMPGNVFLAANSSRQRCLGFCILVRPLCTPTTASGTIHFGNASAASLANGVSTSPDGLSSNVCSESVSVSQALMAPLEIKWSPGSFDDRYSPTWQAGFTGDDDSDRNVLVLVAIGLPPGTGLQIRVTAIFEWSPRPSLGIVQDATSVKQTLCDKECIIRNLKRKDPNWWWGIGKKAFGVGKSLVQGYYTGGAIGAMGAAVKFIK